MTATDALPICPDCRRVIHRSTNGWVHWTGSVWCGVDDAGLITGSCVLGPGRRDAMTRPGRRGNPK